jgi:hypothetical protein
MAFPAGGFSSGNRLGVHDAVLTDSLIVVCRLVEPLVGWRDSRPCAWAWSHGLPADTPNDHVQ